MKRLFLISFILLLLGVPSCKDKDKITPPDQFPQWLELKITELTSEFNICESTHVTIIDYKGKIYYHIYCGLWSCLYCQLFNETGTRPNWEPTEWEDFSANKKVVKTIPACP